MPNDSPQKFGDSNVDRRSQQWHVGKEIPLALIAAIIGQTLFFTVWLSGLGNKVDGLIKTTDEMRQERYTKDDARRDREMSNKSEEFQRQRDAEQDRRINQLEVATGQLSRGVKP